MPSSETMSATAMIDIVGKSAIVERNASTIAAATFRLNECQDPQHLRALNAEQWRHWREYGYVVVPNAIDDVLAHELEALVWEFEGMDPLAPNTWYPPEKSALKRQELSYNAGMIELYHHPLLWAARQSPRIYDAFVDVWGHEQLWVTIDRMNFNLPPEPGFIFKSFMHWDYDPDTDPQNVQGVLAINDQTDLTVGGFKCIPELFQHYADWRQQQDENWDWYRPDVSAFTPTPVSLARGDLLIFNSKLCHGIRQNVSTDKVRIAQYISMMPAQEDNHALREWRIRAWRERLAPQGYSLHGDRTGWQQCHPLASLSELGQKLLGLSSWNEV